MPELPEVETVRRSVAPHVTGVEIAAVALLHPDVIGGVAVPGMASLPATERFEQVLPGYRFIESGRRGKYLLFALAGATETSPPLILVVHLRMTGRLLLVAAEAPLLPHTHVRIALASGDELRFSDVRRFGRLYLYEAARLPLALLRAAGLSMVAAGRGRAPTGDDRQTRPPGPPGLFMLGPEPLGPEFTPDYLAAQLLRRTAPVKAVLLDQRVVAGLGNIYIDEALFRAGLHPARPAGTLAAADARRLHAAIREVLEEALDRRGTTFSDYVDGRGVPGEMRELLAVYGRAGLPCRRCGRTIQKLRIAGRGTHVCERCQPFAGAVRTSS